MKYYKLTPKEALSRLKSSPSGLSTPDVRRRQDSDGLNEVVIEKTPLWRKAIEPFLDIFTAVLAVAVLISVWHKDYIDAIIIAAIIIASAVIYYAQRISAERVLGSLKSANRDTVEVKRDGKIVSVLANDLAAGDVIILREGNKIPADAKLLSAESFRVDESHLTGESLPITKTSKAIKNTVPVYEQSSMVFQGSFVVSGMAQAVITTIGNNTEFGKIAELSAPPITKSPVQQKVDSLITRIIIAIVCVSLIALVLSLRQGMELYDSIRYVIALAVSAVPEGLPIAISVVLVLGMRRMAAKKALARSMRAIETLGAVTTIATDKTGTLTENKLSVKSVWSPNGKKARLLDSMRLSVNMTENKSYDPLDNAIHDYVSDTSTTHFASNPVTNYPFDQDTSMSGCQYHYSNSYKIYIKGAPEKIIEQSDLTESEREKAYLKLHQFTAKGFRVLGFASTSSKHQEQNLKVAMKSSELAFEGLAAVADTLRMEAKAAIATATNAGITVRMITGDHLETAYHIGKQLNLVSRKDQVFDSSSMSSLSDAELSDAIEGKRVFSRVLPEDKHRLLTSLKRHEIVAMTGDGVNDVPALTNAHVGIAMGSGSSIAKDASDMVLVDDNFRSIVDAIREGRAMFANVKRMVVYLLATNSGEVILNLGALALGAPIPLVPVQLLWVNLVTDTSMAIPIGLEPGDSDIMNQPPSPAKAPLLSRKMIFRLLVAAAVVGSLSLGFYLFFLQSHGIEYARSITFTAIVAVQWGNALAMRSDTAYSWQTIRKPNRAFWIGLGASILLHAVVLFTPVSNYLHVTPVALSSLAIVSAISFVAPIVFIDIHKAWCKRRARPQSTLTPQ